MKNVTLTTYLNNKKDIHHKKRVSMDTDHNVHDFLTSSEKNHMSTVVFYDKLSKEFIKRWSSDLTKFKKTEIDVRKSKYSINDVRFFMWRKFIIERDDIENILLADLFDIEFFRNPFELLSIHPKIKIFTGSTSGNNKLGNKSNIKRRMMVKYGKTFHDDKKAGCAGNVMGNRKNILKIVNQMCVDIKSPSANKRGKKNHNLGVFNKVLYDFFDENDVMVGRPFSIHKKNEKWSKDNMFYMKHLFGSRKKSI